MKKGMKFLTAIVAVIMTFGLTACGGIKDPSLEGIKESGKLIVATSPDFPPFEYLEGNKVVGWDIDLAREFAKDIGVKLSVKKMKFDSVLIAPNQQKSHIGMAGISKSPEREKEVDFTDTVFDSKQVMIVKADNTSIKTPFDLTGKKVSCQKGTVGHLLANVDPDWAFIDGNAVLGAPSAVHPFDTGALAVEDVIAGKADAVIIDKYPAEKFVEANKDKVKIVTGAELDEVTNDYYVNVFSDSYAFIVKKGNKTLLDELNSLIKRYKTDGTMTEISNKFFK